MRKLCASLSSGNLRSETLCVWCCEKVWGHLRLEKHSGQVSKTCWPRQLPKLWNDAVVWGTPWKSSHVPLFVWALLESSFFLLASSGERQCRHSSWGLQGNQMAYGGAGSIFSLDTEQVLRLPLKLVDLSGEKNSIFENCLTCKC